MSIAKELNLSTVIRPTLIGLEDTIIFDLFERAKHKRNNNAYVPGAIHIPTPGKAISFFDYILHGTESLHASAGRYTSGDEIPFSQRLPPSLIQRRERSLPIQKIPINENPQILQTYLQALDTICEEGEDHRYGASVVCDIKTLQDLSRRIHFGKYVAEAKYQEKPELYQSLIDLKDTDGIIDELTNIEVEIKIDERVKRKGEKYGMDPEFISAFYRDKIIPITKEVEVEYFMKRKNPLLN